MKCLEGDKTGNDIYKKYRFYIDLLGVFLFGYMSYIFLDRYLNEGHKKMNIISFVFACLMIIIKVIDIIGYITKKTSIENKN